MCNDRPLAQRQKRLDTSHAFPLTGSQDDGGYTLFHKKIDIIILSFVNACERAGMKSLVADLLDRVEVA